MATPSDIFDRIAPTLASDPNKDFFLALAAEQINTCHYKHNANMANALLAAHMLTLSKRTDGEAGALSSKKEGDLAVSYVAGAGQGISDLDQTSYGKQLKRLKKSTNMALGVTGGRDTGCYP